MESKTVKIIVLVSAIVIMVVGAVYVFSASFIPPGITTTGIATYSFWEPEENNPLGKPLTVNFTLYCFREDTAYLINSTITHEITLNITSITASFNASGLYFVARASGYPVYGAVVTTGNNHIVLYNVSKFSIGISALNYTPVSNTSTITAGESAVEFSRNLPPYFAIIYDSDKTIPNATLYWYGGWYSNANITLEGFYVKLTSSSPITVSGSVVAFYPCSDNRTVYLFDVPYGEPIHVESNASINVEYGYGLVA